MKVLLLKDIEHVGSRGGLVIVSDGFARNFLLPRKLASRATAGSERYAATLKQSADRKRAEQAKRDRETAEKLVAASCTLSRKAGEDEKLFGSVTSHDVSAALAEQGFAVDHHQVVLEHPIKALGVYTVTVKVGPGAEAAVKVWVVKG